ncbi:MAG TPA: UDP-N-acetylmuramoyl-L-alanyl-D-glutamate--2,6-diaminopimelate ligase [Rubricoccaceae bacterium]|nr:UDP-N-acetylmuramoyl-L-alanyl-D-glutamate--2,6-diaminopimelate ligase [Rubricoccaceae bacterium]
MSAPRSFSVDPPIEPQPLARLLVPLREAGLLAAPVERAETLVVHAIADDSRDVRPGTLFVAVRGDETDGHLFLDTAVQNGAVAALVETVSLRKRAEVTDDEDAAAQEESPEASSAQGPSSTEAMASTSPLGKGERLPGAVLVPVTDTRAALGEVSNAFYGVPSQRLDLLGVTGTNGKTTTAFLLYHLMTALGWKSGLVGTVENRIGDARIATDFTTPEALELNRLLRAMVDAGCRACAMEVSSHGLALDRVRGQRFRAAAFTNLTHDHLDFHGTVEHYRRAKKRLFDGLDKEAVAVVNRDDPAWEGMVADTTARVVTYGTKPEADLRVEVLDNALDGLRLRLDGAEREFRLAGAFNAYNLAAAYGVARDLGFSQSEVLDALTEARGVPGRFETVRSDDGVLGVVDYAHTPDALENVLRTARQMMSEDGALWVVFGCGGDRDRTKRPVMGRAAELLADRVVVTDDNPRTEDPASIRAAVRIGMDDPSRATEIGDRAEAIAFAATEAAPGDVIVVAGKGHETYQIVGTEKRDFDDRAALRNAFAHRSTSVG